MRLIHTIRELHETLQPGVRRGLVPTMGALHEGHLGLMREARKECDEVVASVFVNPTQFGPGEDFERYPRRMEADGALAASVGVDLVFAPSVEEMYPSTGTEVRVSGVSERWEGAIRPGHFAGAATVVLKLFNIVQPTLAYFGRKDLQQCAVIQKMVRDLNVPVELRFVETVRAPSGLALSSRHAYLSPEEKALAPTINRAVERAAQRIRAEKDGLPEAMKAILDEGIAQLELAGFSVDYFVCVDQDTMEPLLTFSPQGRVMAAAKLGSVRLLDNMPLV